MERPFVFINSAMSADGKISTRQRKQVRISGDADFKRVDRLRAESDAVMIGIGTVLADDPSLTVKSEELRNSRINSGREENPVRIIVDSNARTPVDADIFNKGKGKRIIIVSQAAPEDKILQLQQKAEIIVAGRYRVDISAAMQELKKRGIGKLMVEGGATLNWALISNKLVDEIYTFVGNLVIGGSTAPTFADGEGFCENETVRLELTGFEQIEDGILLKWRVKPA